MSAVKNLKARPKAAPSRIQDDIMRQLAIVDREVVANGMQHLAETEDLNVDNLPDGDLSVPLEFWLEHKQALLARDSVSAVQIASDQDPHDLAEHLGDVQMVVLPFVAHADGRGYSHAHLLRVRLGFKGQIRATGDVKFDQLGFLTRVGCNAFELPESENLNTALRAFDEFSDVYQPAADQAPLIFSRRRAVH